MPGVCSWLLNKHAVYEDWIVFYVSDKFYEPILVSIEQRMDKIFNTLNMFDEMLE